MVKMDSPQQPMFLKIVSLLNRFTDSGKMDGAFEQLTASMLDHQSVFNLSFNHLIG